MDNKNWLELATAVCDHAEIQPGAIEVVRTWETTQNTVYRLEEQRYLKLYHRDPQRQFAVECAALQTLATGGIPAPRIIAASTPVDLPPYVFTTAVPGSSAEESWAWLPRAEQLAVAHAFGAVTAAYHQLPHQPLAAVEQTFGGGAESIHFERAQRLAEIAAAPTLPAEQRTFYDGLSPHADLIDFITSEAPESFTVPLKFSHCDLSHAHLFVAQETGAWRFSGVIDWAEAMLVPSEWDLAYHWFWTFRPDQAAMQASLRAYFADTRPPERFARRCFAAILHTYAWVEIWTALREEFIQSQPRTGSLVRQMTEFLFPPAVFGSPD